MIGLHKLHSFIFARGFPPRALSSVVWRDSPFVKQVQISVASTRVDLFFLISLIWVVNLRCVDKVKVRAGVRHKAKRDEDRV